MKKGEKYQDFLNFFSQKHGLTLTQSEMQDILTEARKLDQKLSIPECGNENYPCMPNLKFGMLECCECGWSE